MPGGAGGGESVFREDPSRRGQGAGGIGRADPGRAALKKDQYCSVKVEHSILCSTRRKDQIKIQDGKIKHTFSVVIFPAIRFLFFRVPAKIGTRRGLFRAKPK
jgi:hypothetical protein